MKKVIYFVLFALLIGIGYYAFVEILPKLNRGKVEIEQLIPEDAIFCIEKKWLLDKLDNDTAHNFGWLSNQSELQKMIFEFRQFDTLLGSKLAYSSAHFINNTEVAFIYYFPNSEFNSAYRVSDKTKQSRTYKEFEIDVYRDSINVLVLESFTVVSTSRLLIESVCRNYNAKLKLNFNKKGLYVNPKLFVKLITNNSTELKEVFSLLSTSNISLKESENYLNISGNSNLDLDSNSSIDLGEFKTFFPMNTAIITNGTKEYLKEKKILKEPVFQLVKNDLVVIYVANSEKLDKVYITKKINIVTNNFFKIDKDYFKGVELTNLSYATATDTNFITIAKLNDFYLISESENTIFEIIQAVNEDNVWGKSLKHYDFLSELSLNASTNIILNSKLLQGENTGFNLMALQQTLSESGGLINGFLSKEFVEKSTLSPVKTRLPNQKIESVSLLIASMDSEIASKPFLMNNHVDGTREFMFQTKDNNLHLLNLDGKKIWSKQLNSALSSSIAQIDVYKNRKLQYAFTTQNEIHLVDRNGKNLDGFPIALKYKIGQFSVLDYDDNKNYRLSLSDTSGNLYLYNMEGQILGDWNAKPTDGKLIAPLQHFRVKDKDCLMAITQTGNVHLFKRNGTYYPGFPIALNENLTKNYSINKNNDFDKSEIILLSEFGNVFSVSLKGEKTKESNLRLVGKSLIATNSNLKEKVFIESDNDLLALYGEKGNELFKTEQKLEGFVNTQYYPFNSQEDLVILISKSSVVIFDKKGNKKAETSANPFDISLLSFEAKKQTVIYFSEGKNLKKVVL